ncbi:UNVERIFIED_CONTAM: hypothetical protein HDU68_001691 [Siphonaria sp. JEL0065]|nr:hypothetical protein HDU68_001691 [Siphonaria sp. JEL0065]
MFPSPTYLAVSSLKQHHASEPPAKQTVPVFTDRRSSLNDYQGGAISVASDKELPNKTLAEKRSNSSFFVSNFRRNSREDDSQTFALKSELRELRQKNEELQKMNEHLFGNNQVLANQLDDKKRELQTSNVQIAQLSASLSTAKGNLVRFNISDAGRILDGLVSGVGSIMEESQNSLAVSLNKLAVLSIHIGDRMIRNRLSNIRDYSGTLEDNVGQTLDTFAIGIMHVNFETLVSSARYQIAHHLLTEKFVDDNEAVENDLYRIPAPLTKLPTTPLSNDLSIKFSNLVKIFMEKAPSHYLNFVLKCVELGMLIVLVKPELELLKEVSAIQNQGWTDLYSFDDLPFPEMKERREPLVLLPGLVVDEKGDGRKRVIRKALVVSP